MRMAKYGQEEAGIEHVAQGSDDSEQEEYDNIENEIEIRDNPQPASIVR